MTINKPLSGDITENSFASPLPDVASGVSTWQGLIDIHPALKDVQAMKEFKPKDPGWLDPFLQQPWIKDVSHKVQTALEELLKAIHHFFSSLRPPVVQHMPEHLSNLFTGVIGFLIGLLVLYSFYLLLSYLIHYQNRQIKPSKKPLGQTAEAVLLINTHFHQEQAKMYAASGNYKFAARQLYYSLLCLLDERNIVPFEKNRTNFEYEEALANLSSEDLQSSFRTVSGIFEAERYGAQSVTAQEYTHCQQHYRLIAETSAQFRSTTVSKEPHNE